MKLKAFFLIAAALTLTAVNRPRQSRASGGIQRAELQVAAPTFIGEDGYLSPVMEAPLAFNALFSEWSGELTTAVFQLQLRTGKDGRTWSDWQTIAQNGDWSAPDANRIVGDVLLVPLPDARHRYLQYRLQSAQTNAPIAPQTGTLRFVFIDSVGGLTAAELLAKQETAVGDPSLDNPKPTVIDRDSWCTHPDCTYSDGLTYAPVTHLIVHHTASGNHGTDYDWASVVRAIWEYHTYELEWGDIGYQYLVDPNGVLYEGHLGGDDVVGIHAGAANTGSMALSFLGNFSDIAPMEAAMEAGVDLLAWKAEQKEINIFDAATMPNLEWGLFNLSGHRDVYGGTATECPGESLHELLPSLRQQVGDRIGLIDPHIYIEETSAEFTRSDPALYWWVPEKGCGHNRHAFYTWSVTNPVQSTNWGEWRPTITENGRYQIDAYIPYCDTGRGETAGAAYEINYASGSITQTVSQSDYAGLWLPLGEYNLATDQETMIRLTDLTGTDSDLGVWFDSLRLRRILGTAMNVAPAANSWQSTRDIAFEWELTAPDTILTTTLQAASDAAFENLLVEETWNTAVFSHTHAFAQDYAALHWRVGVLVDSGELRYSPATQFGLDAAPPASTVTAVYQTNPDFYVLQWQGSDNLSGVARYTVEYREDGGTEWTTLIAKTPYHSIAFAPPLTDTAYYFRSQAVDHAGNSEPPHALPDISTEEAVLLDRHVMIPVVVMERDG